MAWRDSSLALPFNISWQIDVLQNTAVGNIDEVNFSGVLLDDVPRAGVAGMQCQLREETRPETDRMTAPPGKAWRENRVFAMWTRASQFNQRLYCRRLDVGHIAKEHKGHIGLMTNRTDACGNARCHPSAIVGIFHHVASLHLGKSAGLFIGRVDDNDTLLKQRPGNTPERSGKGRLILDEHVEFVCRTKPSGLACRENNRG